MSDRIAALDIGTNTVLLLIANVSDQGTLEVLYEEERFARLGQGVDASGRVNTAAMQRVRDALLAYRSVMASYGVEDVTIGATSASRDARNQDELIGYIQAETGLRYDILSGEEEALWTFRGAVSAFEGRTGSCIVMDLGGGSTEVVVGRIDDGSLQSRTSLNLGAVRITERFFSALPPSGDDVIQAQQFMNSTFQTLPLARNSALPLIGTSGSTTAKLAALHAGFQSEINRPNDYFSMTADAVQGWSERLLTCTADEVLALNKAAMHGRADVFAAGVLILNTFMQFFGFDAYEVSPRGLRHGLALRWLARKQRTPMDSA